MKISEQDMKEAKELMEILQNLDDMEKKMATVYVRALRDRKMYAAV